MSSQKLKETLLVVEDDSDMRDAILESLQGLGCQLHACANAEDGLTFARSNPCFAVFSDYRMPGMNGIEFCRRLKIDFPRIKFVVLTGFADKQTVLDGFRVGIDDLLEKPEDLIRLRDKAESFVRARAEELAKEQQEMLALRQVFCEEANDILRDLDTYIFKLEEVPPQPEVVDVLFRKAHTLKGSAAAFPGTEKLSMDTHAYENLLQSLRKGKLKPSQALTHVLLQGADVIKSLLSDFEAGRERAVNLQPFVEALNRWTEGHVGSSAQGPQAVSKPQIQSQSQPQVSFPVQASVSTALAQGAQEPAAPAEASDDGIIWVEEPEMIAAQQPKSSVELPQVNESSVPQTPSLLPVTRAEPLSANEPLPTLAQTLMGSETPPKEDEDDGLFVSIEKLNSFMELSGELVVLKNAYHAVVKQVLKYELPQEQKQRLEEMNQSLDKISEQIQGQIMDVRKVQLKVAFQKFPRIVRQVSCDLQKQVRLEMTGTELGVDKSIAKALSSALVHVVRNAVDHGIEMPDVRLAKNKAEFGVLRIHSNQVADRIVITIDDDGAGIDPEQIKRKALEKGLITRDKMQSMNAQEAIDLIFLPGFSTAEKVTSVSGRGVGMDVVRTEISKLGGTCTIESTPGLGTRLSIVLPVPKTVLVENTLLTESGGHQIVVPLVSISKITPIRDLILSKVDGRMTCQHEGVTIPLGDYRSFIESPLKGSAKEKMDFSPDSLVLIISHKEHALALVVDRVVDQLEAVVRPFDNVVEKLLGFKGTSLLDSEHVAFVLDAESIVGAAYAA
jgi:two-component system chemotaxis sensor kinase CheA